MYCFDQHALRVLVIEDDQDDAMLIDRFLRYSPFGSVEFEHGRNLREGIDLLRKNDFDVALLDMTLPDGLGIDSLHKLQAVDARLPVVILTGSDDESLGIQAIHAGAQDYLVKSYLSGGLLLRSLCFAVARQQKFLGLEAAADRDPLTGMSNRRFLEKEFEQLKHQALSTGHAVSFGLLDIDHFKSINDEHGHLAGDAALKQVAALLTGLTRDYGHAVRYGGEEFAFVFPNCSRNRTTEILEQVIQRIGGEQLCVGEKRISITASVGVASVNESDSCESALQRADAALYQAKRSGRNRVVCEGTQASAVACTGD